MKQYEFGIIGAGHMGQAIADGAVDAGVYQRGEVLLCDPSAENRAQNAARGYAVTGDCGAVYQQCDMVLISVRPQNIAEVLETLAPLAAAARPLVVSIAAGVPFARIEAALGADCPIVRVMPNTPLMLGIGASALAANPNATAEQLGRVASLFDKMGVTVTFTDENMLCEVIPYNGSLPAYVYAFIEGMTKSAEQHGIARADALRLICRTCAGAAAMVEAGEFTPNELISQVCSPGGTTIEAINIIRESDFDDILARASDKCIARAYELGK